MQVQNAHRRDVRDKSDFKCVNARCDSYFPASVQMQYNDQQREAA